MRNIIKLDNDYYIEEISNEIELPINAVNICALSLLRTLQNKNIILKVNFAEFSVKDYRKILKRLLIIKNIAMKMNRELGITEEEKRIIAYVVNFDKSNINHKDFISAINAIFFRTRYDRYNYIYDTVCDYLDGFFYGKNLCDFENNKCGEKRNSTSTTGCCHHFKHRVLGPFSKFVLCEYLNKENYTCDAKCLGCKLFTCDYLESKGIKFKIKDILLLNVFFNPMQKFFIKYMVFTPKDKILKRLMIL